MHNILHFRKNILPPDHLWPSRASQAVLEPWTCHGICKFSFAKVCNWIKIALMNTEQWYHRLYKQPTCSCSSPERIWAIWSSKALSLKSKTLQTHLKVKYCSAVIIHISGLPRCTVHFTSSLSKILPRPAQAACWQLLAPGRVLVELENQIIH